MKTYIVSLIRSYAVTIEAENEENACRHAEFFIGDCHDLSTYKDKQKVTTQRKYFEFYLTGILC